jgi:large repetitive protein
MQFRPRCKNISVSSSYGRKTLHSNDAIQEPGNHSAQKNIWLNKWLAGASLFLVICLTVCAAHAQGVTAFTIVSQSHAASSPQTLSIAMTPPASGVAFTSISVVTQGNQSGDFTDAGSDTCFGNSCTVNVQFKPKSPGAHYGAVVLSFGSVNVVQFLYGISTGPIGVIVPGEIITAAGATTFTYVADNVPADTAPIELPLGEVVDAAGNLYLSDSGNFRIRKVDTTGTITTYVGNGQPGSSGDNGPATSASITSPSALVVDGAGNLYFTDSSTNVIRMVDATTHIITTVAGIAGQPGGPDPNASQPYAPIPLTGALLNQPKGLALDGNQNLYVADSGNNLVRTIDLKVILSSRTITTIAGSLTAGFGGDGQVASAAIFNQPWGIALGLDGSLYVADVNNNVIRKLDPTGTGKTATVVGVQTNGQGKFAGDGGSATAANLQNPEGVAVDLAGNIYIADTENNRIRKVDNTPQHIISTISGGNSQGYSGDGANSDIATLNAPSSVALDASGDLFLGDLFNNRVRMISGSLAIPGDFGQIKNYQISTSKPETFENDGNDVLTQNPSAPFIFSNAALDPTSTCLSATTLQPGNSCTLGVEFAPQVQGLPAGGAQTAGTITIQSDAANPSPVVDLSGDVLTVNPTTVSVQSNGSPSASGAPVIFSATVTNGGNGNGPITGTVNFLDNGVSIGSGTIASGTNSGTATVTFTTTSLALGTHPITAAYAGDLNNAPSPASFVFTQVVKNGTSLALTSSLNPSTFPANVTFTATLSGQTSQVTGTVTFLDGGTALGAAVVPNAGGVAIFSTTTLAPGAHAITATFAGDTNDLASSSGSLSETVQQTPSTTLLSANASTVTLGTSVNFTVSVSNSNNLVPTPSGTVALSDNGILIPNGSGVLTAGAVTIAISTLTPGTHTITASYSGDTDNAVSISGKLTEIVNTIATSTVVTSTAPNPANAGATVSLTATVTSPSGTSIGGALTGTVQFFDGTNPIGTPQTLTTNGFASQSVPAISLGSHSFTAVYNGNTNYSTSTSSIYTVMVDQVATTTLVSSTPSPSIAGKSVTLTATVSGLGGIPTGQVNFTQNGVSVGSANLDANGHAVFTTSSLPVGSDPIVASYVGDTNDKTSNSTSLTQVVTIAQTSLALSASANNPVLAGVPLTLSITLTGQGAQPTGPVTVTDNGSLLGTVTISSATPVTLPTNSLSVGTHSITASFAGDTNNTSSTASISVVVNQVPTTTTLTSSQNPGVLNQPIVFTANVMNASNSGLTAGGSISFQDNGTPLAASVPLNGSGSASLTLSTLSLGSSHSIVAIYSGDANHIASQSTAIKQQILQAAAIALTSNINPSTAEINVTFTARLTGVQGLIPTGSVSFKDGANVLGVINVDPTGLATITTTSLTVGPHSITAGYSGDTNYQPVSSSTLTQTVLIANTSVTLASSANPATSGLPLTFSTLVTGTGGPVSGSVTFEDGTTILGKSALSASGSATFTTAALTPGRHVITAVYSGDSNNSPNTSAILQQQVQQVTVASLASNANPALTLAPVVITCTVTNGNSIHATGLVTFTDGTSVIGSVALDNNGVATLSLPSLPAGQHSIVAAYSGDTSDFPSTSSPLGQVVQLRATSDVLTATNDVITTTTVTSSPTNGEQLTLISVVRWTGPTTPTGSVTFKLGNTVVGTALVDNVGLATLTVVLDPGAAEFVASYSGDSVYSASNSPATPITQGPPTSFTMQLSPAAVTVASKQNTTVTLTLSSLNGFSDTLSLGCLGLPFAATCTFSSDQSGLAANGTQVIHVVVDTGSPLTAGSVAKNDSPKNSSKAMLCFLPCGALLGWALMRSRKRRPLIGLLLLLCSIGLTLGLSGCGTLNINGTPAGTYTFKITAAGVNTGVTQSTVVTLTVQ